MDWDGCDWITGRGDQTIEQLVNPTMVTMISMTMPDANNSKQGPNGLDPQPILVLAVLLLHVVVRLLQDLNRLHLQTSVILLDRGTLDD